MVYNWLEYWKPFFFAILDVPGLKIWSQFVNVKNNRDGGKNITIKIPVRYFYEQALQTLRDIARVTEKFTVVNANEGLDIEAFLPGSSFLIYVLHVWVSDNDHGEPELRFGFTGPASFYVKDILKGRVLSEFNVTMLWNEESKVWQSKSKGQKREGKKAGEDDIVDFEKIQAVSNFVMTLGTNYKKNLSQLNPGILAKYPDFLAEVQHE